MDPSPVCAGIFYFANLRSRGDGPDSGVCSRSAGCKPPLTRRWTPDLLRRQRRRRQTSAHAGMNLRFEKPHVHAFSKPRSRGDEPRRVAAACRSRPKTPLTRRWTGYSACFRSQRQQTSAHAEMDHLAVLDVEHILANLRSRGDGPIGHYIYRPLSSKPPLTRRWTPSLWGVVDVTPQTSAHAEMDPLSSCSTAQITANLRSRGDGPTALFLRGGRVFKPPLTRRWTRYLSHGISKMPQTSAHAEMDLAPATQTKIFKPNLRSRGDEPAVYYTLCKAHGKTPLTRG